MADPKLDPAIQLGRARLLEELSRLDGRQEPDHPWHGHFTGIGRPFTRLMELESKVVELESRIYKLENPEDES